MRAATLFSGIGAPECACPDWQWLWHAEIEPFPAAVMAARHPGSINLGDVTSPDFVERALRVGRPDVVVFGSPCQSFSVAGKRLGMEDPRGNLARVGLEVVRRLGAPWLVFENVPGLLSSDFGAFLRAVAECGYLGVWRVLDAQFTGVPQRRRRVFFVGHLGDWRPAAEVLFEPASLQGHPPPSRAEGQDVAHSITTRAGNGSRPAGGTGNLAFGGNNTAGPIDVATACNAHGGPHGRCDFESETFVCGTLQANSGRCQADAQYVTHARGEDGTGRGTPLVPVAFNWQSGGDCRGLDPHMTTMALTREQTPAIAFDTTQITSKTNRSNPQPGGPSHPLAAGAHAPAIAFTCKDHGADSGELAPTLRAMGHGDSWANGGGQVAVAFNNTGQGWWNQADAAQSVRKGDDSGGGPRESTLVGSGMAVRRLTPLETERLQGLPDDYTAITFRGKPAADGPRYKAVGNSMAVPCIAWILRRLERVAAQQTARAA